MRLYWDKEKPGEFLKTLGVNIPDLNLKKLEIYHGYLLNVGVQQKEPGELAQKNLQFFGAWE
ncbi:hypothetical protein PRBEI_2000559600 [Prionailurus iriomotensis]